MKKILSISAIALLVFQMSSTEIQAQKTTKPNIIYILADDLGYGDLAVYNKGSKIATPNLDKLASQGMRFTDAHSTSGVCTPTRYSVMTGRYPWRSKLPVGVMHGYNRPLIENDRATVASMLKKNGYNTGVVGKWHLGLGWAIKPEYATKLNDPFYGVTAEMDSTEIDFNKDFTSGPNSVGFDYSYVLPASLDMQPYCYIENHKFVEPLTTRTVGRKPEADYARAFWREGKMSTNFDFYNVVPTFMDKATQFIKKQSASKPFFLYLPVPAPHTPWVPSAEFSGKSSIGEYGDFVMQLDAAVGKLLATLDSMDMTKNTMIVFTSDNGPYWRDNYIKKYEHKASGELRGMKGDAFEAGHRVPFIVRWPAAIKAGTVSNATTTLANLMATCADMVGENSPAFKTEDSYSLLPVLTGKTNTVTNQPAVVHISSIGYMVIRQGDWKLIQGLGSGGFTLPKEVKPAPGEAPGQLYNLAEDPHEDNNVYDKYPEKVKALTEMLNNIKQSKTRFEK
jgi:arylsulfatase A-like enzyme